eukprot:1696423-Pyramimonas_sp.AAC.1
MSCAGGRGIGDAGGLCAPSAGVEGAGLAFGGTAIGRVGTPHPHGGCFPRCCMGAGLIGYICGWAPGAERDAGGILRGRPSAP